MVAVPWFSNEVAFADDILNSNRNRNIRNTSKLDYNCGGYALGTFNWYMPFLDEESHISLEFGSYEEAATLTSHCVKCMLIEFRERNLRLIPSLDCLEENEYAFAFRIASDGDFHYVRRHTSGKWFHKQGAGSIIYQMTKEEVFSESWCNGRYDGPLVLFAIQR